MTFTDQYRNKKQVLSLEFFPPKYPEDMPSTLQMVARLKELAPDFMTVTYGAGGGTRSRTKEITAFIANEIKISAVAHLTCVGHSQAEIDQVLDDLKRSGIRRILALRGDPPNNDPDYSPHPEGFSCARDLAQHIKRRGDFSIAVAGYPETHTDARSPADDIRYLKEKIDAGAEVIITQLFFDCSFYFGFLERARAAGIKVPIVPGIMPIGNVKQLKRFTSMCGASIPAQVVSDLEEIEDKPKLVADYGTALAIAMSAELLEKGAPGIHLYTLNKCGQVEQVVAALKKRGFFG